MEELDRPPLTAEAREQLEVSQYSIQKRYHAKLEAFAEDIPHAIPFKAMISGHRPPSPPRQPIAFGKCLAEYALELFDGEAHQYPKDERLVLWLEKLSQRVEERIMGHIPRIGLDPLRGDLNNNLTYHLTEQKMLEAIRAALKSRTDTSRSSPTSPVLSRPSPPKPQPVKKPLAAMVEPIDPVGFRHQWKTIDSPSESERDEKSNTDLMAEQAFYDAKRMDLR